MKKVKIATIRGKDVERMSEVLDIGTQVMQFIQGKEKGRKVIRVYWDKGLS